MLYARVGCSVTSMGRAHRRQEHRRAAAPSTTNGIIDGAAEGWVRARGRRLARMWDNDKGRMTVDPQATRPTSLWHVSFESHQRTLIELVCAEQVASRRGG